MVLSDHREGDKRSYGTHSHSQFRNDRLVTRRNTQSWRRPHIFPVAILRCSWKDCDHEHFSHIDLDYKDVTASCTGYAPSSKQSSAKNQHVDNQPTFDSASFFTWTQALLSCRWCNVQPFHAFDKNTCFDKWLSFKQFHQLLVSRLIWRKNCRCLHIWSFRW
jgi:hypothetical protein